MTRRVVQLWPVIWVLIVAAQILTGTTTSSPGPWLTSMGVLMMFMVLAWRFLVPGLILAPAPAVPVCAVGLVLVAGRAGSIDGPLSAGFRDPSAWLGLSLAGAAVLLALSAPFTGVRESVAELMLFPLRDGRWLAVEGDGR